MSNFGENIHNKKSTSCYKLIGFDNPNTGCTERGVEGNLVKRNQKSRWTSYNSVRIVSRKSGTEVAL